MPAAAVAIEDEEGQLKVAKKKKKKPPAYTPVLTTPYGDLSQAPVEKQTLLGS